MNTLRYAAFVIAAAALVTALGATPAFAKSFDCYSKPGFKSITISWSEVSGTATYRLFRADATACITNDADFPAEKDYRKLASVTSKAKRTFTDKSAKSDHYYCYTVKAYSKKGKLLKSSFQKGTVSYACKGFGKPTLLNNGYGENHVNSAKALHIALEPGFEGVPANNATWKIYRKASGQKKFTLWKTLRCGGSFDEVTDTDVKAGTTYRYRAKLVRTVGKKTYYSPYSDAVKIPAVAFRPKYKVKALSSATAHSDGSPIEVSLKLVNASSTNGTTRVFPSAATYTYATVGSKNAVAEEISFTAYSTDNTTWKRIPAKGVKLPAKGKGVLYLKGCVTNVGGTETTWLGNDASKASLSSIDIEGGLFEYAGPGVGETYGSLDLIGGTGYAYQEWD